MSDLLGNYVAGRERVSARPGRLSFDIPTAAGQLSDSMGLTRAQKWALDLATELRAAAVPSELIRDLAVIAAVLEDEGEEGDAQVITEAITLLMGSHA